MNSALPLEDELLSRFGQVEVNHYKVESTRVTELSLRYVLKIMYCAVGSQTLSYLIEVQPAFKY